MSDILKPIDDRESFTGNFTDKEFGCFQESFCKGNVTNVMIFAMDEPRANIEYCQRIICRNSFGASLFIRNIPESDIEYCYKYCNSGDKAKARGLILSDGF